MSFLAQVAAEINKKSKLYKVGKLQSVRKKIHKFSKIPSSQLFDHRTVFEDWGWHYGGRKELQFNIGIEGEFVRYGVAFSLECSQSLPNIDMLVPKISRFNEYLSEFCENFSDLRMWHYENGVRSSEYMPSSIPQERVKEGVFIFLGARSGKSTIDYDKILEILDRLLPIYLFIEGDFPEMALEEKLHDFRFIAGCTKKLSQTSGLLTQRELDIRLRHNDYQSSLYKELSALHGEDNVGTEIYANGLSIDLVVKQGESYWFYEIKTASTARACIRQALGQIMEYSFWPGHQRAAKLVIVGSAVATSEESSYIEYLQETFRLPLEYRTVD
ncbi:MULTISPECIES: hypothetical protein [Pseudomonas]|uniref:hypothetical protein n=1 Tax=Pseudomonas TaxID=286 RepID=UPI000CFFF438|nr:MULTISPECIES: hypothetical protein [Pseudomonas]PRA47390.1 hypothetical protein CQZ98_22160 [Pseudomonas sp. MYb115]QXN47885.1 hypothetical protein KW062_16410 [Pseudomonas fluorescens]WSO22192.1 hypothetical protein VUJ50_16505 [Pseudomonas fluorescens]